MVKRIRSGLCVLFPFVLFLTACAVQPGAPIIAGAQPATPATTSAVPAAPTTAGAQSATPAPMVAQPTLPAVGNGESAGGGGETTGVENALVTYADAAQGFSIGHPGPWTQDKSVTQGVKFAGGDAWFTLTFVTLPAGQDAMAYAQKDVAADTAAFPGFKQLSLAPSTEVNGAIILGFTANGTSAVTGKAFTARNEIYYIPVANGRLGVLTVVGPENIYDREGVRDIALTLKVTK